MKFLDYLKRFDLFGVQFSNFLDKGDIKYKTYFGAIITILIYSTGFSYMIYTLYLWQSDQTLPQISQVVNSDRNRQYEIQQNSITINFFQSIYDVFDENETILIPQLLKYQNTDIIEQQTLKGSKGIVQISNITLQQQKTGLYYTLLFSTCNQSSLTKSNIKCASEDKINKFFNSLTNVALNIQQKQFNTQINSFQNTASQYYFAVEKGIYSQNMVLFSQGTIRIDKGLIFAESTFENVLSKIQVYGQSLSNDYTMLKYNQESLLGFIISLDNYQYDTHIAYPLLGSILAQVGSIFSLLMTLSILVQSLNQIKLEQYLKDEIIGFYFPQYKNIKIKRGIFCNKKIRIFSKDNNTEYQSKNLDQIIQQASENAIQKLNLLNIIYEISRIQFILQSMQNRDVILQIKKQGISLPLVQINQNKINPVNEHEVGINNKDIQQEIIYNDSVNNGLHKIDNTIHIQKQNSSNQIQIPDSQIQNHNQNVSHNNSTNIRSHQQQSDKNLNLIISDMRLIMLLQQENDLNYNKKLQQMVLIDEQNDNR